MSRRLFLLPLLAAGILAAAFAAMPAVAGAAGGGAYTCAGGSIPAGNYSSITVNGVCTVDAGNVTVQHNLTVASGGGLLAAFGGSDLAVGGNLTVESNAALVLGCEPEAFVCFNDPDQEVGTLMTHHTIAGNLIADGALAVLVHANTIHGNAVVSGGGGGVNCDSQDILQGSPAYATFEDNTIGRNLTITGWQSCWLGAIRNNVSGNLIFQDNATFLDDGNEVVTNSIARNLICNGNDPAPHVGDSEGSLNHATRGIGQCASMVAP